MGSRDFDGMLEVCTSTLMAQIRNFTEDQLQNLLQDETRLNNMVDSLSQISTLPNDKEMKLAQSKSLAEYNLSNERKINEALTKLRETQSKAIDTKKEVEQLKVEYDKIAESRSLDTVCTMLKTLSKEADDESEKLSGQFLNGAIDIDEFVQNFNNKRAVAHARKVKAEKLFDLLSQQQYQPARGFADNSRMNQQTPAALYPMPGYGTGGANYRHSYYS